MRSLFIVVLCCMPGCDSVLSVRGYTGGTVSIDCPYKEEQWNNDKYFCKERSWYGCKNIIKTHRKNTWARSQRFSLYDNTSEKYFRVVIKDLRKDDEGTYWCGVDIVFIDSPTKVKLYVNDIHSQRAGTKTAYIGGKITVECHLPENEGESSRYFCKEDYETNCVGISSSWYLTELEMNRRFTLFDNRKDAYNLAIANLTDYDAGTYWCAVGQWTQAGSYISLIQRVQLNIVNWKDIAPVKADGIDGGSVILNCNYPKSHEANEKFICKGENPFDCAEQIKTSKQNERVTNGRFWMRDNPRMKHFTVGIVHLKLQDSGLYWCGSDRTWQPADYTRIHLSVEATTTIPSKRTTTTTSKPHTTSTTPTPSQTVTPSTETSFSTSARAVPSTAHASSALSTASPVTSLKRNTQLVTIVSVCLTVLVVTLILLVLYKRNTTKAKGAHSSSVFQITSDYSGNREDLDINWHHEEIVERSLHPEAGPALFSIYVTATSPTDHTDSLEYSTVNFLKNSNCPNETPTAVVSESTPSCIYSTIKVRPI